MSKSQFSSAKGTKWSDSNPLPNDSKFENSYDVLHEKHLGCDSSTKHILQIHASNCKSPSQYFWVLNSSYDWGVMFVPEDFYDAFVKHAEHLVACT